jgi:DNA recombination protein Rad52
MAFTDEQRQALNAKLRYRHVKMRSSNGAQLAYVEGWHAISEANRIFGYESWDRQTLAPRCVWQEKQRGETACIYSTKVRITVRAGEVAIVREGVGTGIGRSTSAETAHDIALKAAETDATKRALATFGNPFGLALYDKDKRGVTRQQRRGRPKKTQRLLPPPLRLMLHHADGTTHSYASVAEFVIAALQCVQDLPTRAAVYAFWEANLDCLSVASRAGLVDGEDPARIIGVALKARLHALAGANKTSGLPAAEARENLDVGVALDPAASEQAPPAATADAGELLLPKDKRIRDKAHLAFVAGQPCLVCGRRPAQAHHIRFAQPRGLGLKVSDEFTVPLCNGHHQSLHQTGDERAWWARHGILDPLMLANRLWAVSHQGRGRSPPPPAPFDDEFEDISQRPQPREQPSSSS